MYDYEYVGLFKSIYGGIQIDLNMVITVDKEDSSCNHKIPIGVGAHNLYVNR